MNSILVIGYGNVLRGDDGAGIAAAEQIARRFPQVDVLTAHQLQPELAETIAWYDTVVFVDASVTANDIEMKQIPSAQEMPSEGTHTTTPGGLVTLSAALYDRAPNTVVLGTVPARVCDHGETLSAATARKVGEFVDQFASQLAHFQMPQVVDS